MPLDTLNQNSPSLRIIPPDIDQIRSRKVISRRNCGHVYKFQSIKCARTLHLESQNERNYSTILEFDPSVIYFQEQPFTLEYRDDEGEIKICYPDLLVFSDDGSMTVVEIKPASEVAKPEITRKFQLEKMALEQHGYEFELITELDINNGPRLKNSFKLKPYRRDSVNAILREQVLEALRDREMSGRDLISQVTGLTHELLLSMQAKGFVYTDLSLPLDLESKYSASKRQSRLTESQLRIFERRCV